VVGADTATVKNRRMKSNGGAVHKVRHANCGQF